MCKKVTFSKERLELAGSSIGPKQNSLQTYMLKRTPPFMNQPTGLPIHISVGCNCNKFRTLKIWKSVKNEKLNIKSKTLLRLKKNVSKFEA